MEERNYIGIVFVTVGATLIPLGWMFSDAVTVAGYIIFCLGLVVFMTRRYLRKWREAEARSSGGPGVPTDIHSHSGWASGGRSDNWRSSSDGDVDGGGE